MRFGKESCKISTIIFFGKGKDHLCWIILGSSALCAECPSALGMISSFAPNAAPPTIGLAIRKKASASSTTCTKRARTGSLPPRPKRPTPARRSKTRSARSAARSTPIARFSATGAAPPSPGNRSNTATPTLPEIKKTAPTTRKRPRLPAVSGALEASPLLKPVLAALCPPSLSTLWEAFPLRRF